MKHSTLMIILIVIISMICNTIPYLAFANPSCTIISANNVFLKCGFETGFKESADIYAKNNIAEIVSFDGDMAVHMKKTSSDDEFANLYLSNYDADSVVYSVEIYAVNKNIHSEFYFVDSDKNLIEAFNLSAPTGTLSFLDSKMKIDGGNGKKNYSVGTWHTVSVVINKPQKTKSVYVNGTVIAENINVNSSFDWDKVDFFRMHIKGTQTGDEMYIDNVHIYGGTTPRDVTSEECSLSHFENGGSVFEGTEKWKKFMNGKISYHKRSGLLYRNGERLVYKPVLLNDVLMVPCEIFGAAFDMNCDISETGAEIDDIIINKSGITVENTPIDIREKPFYNENTWYVPLEEICVAIGKNVIYDESVISGGIFLVGDSGVSLPESETDKKALNDFLLYERPTMKTVSQDINSSALKGIHPRILATDDDFERIRNLCETDEHMNEWKNKLINTAEGYLGLAPLEWILSDGVRLHNANELHRQVMVLSLAYQLTGETKYAEQAYVQMRAGAEWKDWHPEHTLDTSAAAIGMAIGYDWLYDYLVKDSEKLNIVEQGMYKNGIEAYVSGYRNRNSAMVRGIVADNNWGPVVNAGGAVIALALSDIYPDEAAYIVSNSVRAIEPALIHFAPNGSWYEGIGYASMTQEYIAYHFSVMDDILGTVYSTDCAEGLSTSARSILHLQSPLGAFAYLDGASQSVQCDSALLYLAEYYNDSGVVGTWFDTFDIDWNTDDLVRTMLWYNPESVSKHIELEKDIYNSGDEVITARDSWDKDSDTFIGMKGGTPNMPHGHMDIGDFAFYSNGTRWTGFIGSENYNLDGYWEYDDESPRWTYYGLRAEAKNCLVINPDESGGFISDSNAVFTRFESKPKGVIAVLDMTSSYGSDKALKAQRGYFFADNRQSLVVRDEIDLVNESDLCWFMQTEHNCEIIGDSVIISSKTTPYNRMVLSFKCSDDFVISVDKSKPLDTSPSPAGIKDTGWMNRIMLKMVSSKTATITAKLTPYKLDMSDVSEYDTSFENWSISDGNIVKTECDNYSEIPSQYDDTVAFPFAVFNADGSFKGAYDAWATNQNTGALPSCPDGGTILLRRNFNVAWADNNMKYYNLCYDKGTKTVDLGGYTFDLTYHNTTSMFNYLAKGTGGPLNIIVKNGCIVYGRNSVVGFSQNTNAKTNTVNFSFDDVVFKHTTTNSGPNPSNRIISYASAATNAYHTMSAVEFNDCIFDITSLAYAVPLFDSGESGGSVRVMITVQGGRVIASSGIKNSWTSVNNTYSKIVQKANEDGMYLTLTVPNGTSVPNLPVGSADKTYYFDKSDVGHVTTQYYFDKDLVIKLTSDRVSVLNVEDNLDLYIASFDGDIMCDVKKIDVDTDYIGNLNLIGLNMSESDELKVFLWKNNTLIPMCINKSAKIGR